MSSDPAVTAQEIPEPGPTSTPPIAAPAPAAAGSTESAEALAREAAVSPPETAARLLTHAGHVAAREGASVEVSRTFYESALAKDPGYRPALEALVQLASAHADHDALLARYDDLAALAREPQQKFELLRAKASFARRAGKSDAADAARAEAAALLPDHPAVVEWSVEAARVRGDLATLLELDEKIARATKDDRYKARHLARAARTARQLSDTERAVALHRAWLDVNPSDLETQSVVQPLARAAEDLDTLEKILRAEVEVTSSAAPRVRLARFLAARRGQPAEAREILAAAREIDARDLSALELAADLAEQSGDVAGADAALEELFEASREPATKASALLRLARRAAAAGQAETSLRHYQRVLEILPSHPEALAATAAPPAPPTAEQALAEAESALAAETDPAARPAHLVRIGLVLEELQRPDDAAARYLDAFSLSPAHLGARSALVRLYERGSRWQELNSFYEKEYMIATDEARKREALVVMAELAETKLDDVASAQAAYRMALELVPDISIARSLVRCAEKTNKPRDLAFGLEKEASFVPDRPRRRVALLHRAAEIHHHTLRRPHEALRLHREILEIEPGFGPSLRALDLIAQTNPDLVPERAPKPRDDAAELDVTKALAEKRWDDAAGLFSAFLDAAPAHPTARLDLARVHLERHDPAQAIAQLEAQAERLADAVTKGHILARAAEIADDAGNAEKSEQLADAAAGADASRIEAWHLVARLALARADAAKAARAVEQASQASQLKDRTTSIRRLAALLADHLGDRPRALELFKQLFDEDASDLWALAELERLHREAGEHARSAEFRSRLASRCADPRLAAHLRTTSAEDRSVAGDIEAATNEYRRVLAVDGRIRLAIDEVLAALTRKGDRPALIDLYQRIAPYFENEMQAVLSLRRGELLERDGQTAQAQRCYRDALSSDPLLLPALRAARRLHEAAGEWDDVRALLAQEGEMHADALEGVALIVAAGEIAEEKLRSAEQAESHYLKALERVPGQRHAVSRLDALLRPQGRFAELVTIEEREAEAVSSDPVRSAELYAEAAWIRYEKLGEDRRAMVPLNRALARDATCTRALELKSILALSSGNAAEAEAAVAAALQRDPSQAGRLHARLAQARLSSGNAAGALEAARAATESEPSAEHLELLHKAAVAARDDATATEAIEKLLASTTDRIAAARYARTAAHDRLAIEDTAGADGLFQRALAYLPGDPEAAAGLEKVHEATPEKLAETWLALANAPGLDAPTVRHYRTRAAQAWIRADKPSAALAIFESALQTTPTDATMRLSYARVLASAPDARAKAIAECRTVLLSSPVSSDAIRELARLFEADGRTDAAFVARAALVGLGTASPEERDEYTTSAEALPKGLAQPLAAEALESILHPVERGSPIREFFATVAPALAKIVAGNLARHGIKAPEPIEGEVRAAAESLATALGAGDFALVSGSARPLDAFIENTDPPSLVLGTGLLSRPADEQRFVLGSLLARLRMGNHAAFFAQPIDIANLVAEFLRQVDPSFSRFGTRNETMAQLVARHAARADRKRLEALLPRFQGAVNFGAYTVAATHSANRFGLVACNDPVAALSWLARDTGKPQPPPAERADVREVLSFALGEEYLTIRQKHRLALA